MKRKQFTEEQMIMAVKAMEAGRTAMEIGRELGIRTYATMEGFCK